MELRWYVTGKQHFQSGAYEYIKVLQYRGVMDTEWRMIEVVNGPDICYDGSERKGSS